MDYQRLGNCGPISRIARGCMSSVTRREGSANGLWVMRKPRPWGEHTARFDGKVGCLRSRVPHFPHCVLTGRHLKVDALETSP